MEKTKKIHSCPVSYDQLSESDKEFDRDMVRGSRDSGRGGI